MAGNAWDFRPVDHSEGAQFAPRYARLSASAAIVAGQPIYINADGQMDESPEDADEITAQECDGLAAEDADTTRTDGFARSAGDIIAYFPINSGMRFKTNNWHSSVGTRAVPPRTAVGDDVEVVYDSGTEDEWCLDATGATVASDVYAHVIDVLNVDGQPVAIGDTTTGVWVVFTLNREA